MWLHKHGWKYFESNIESIYEEIRSDNFNRQISRVMTDLKNILEELLTHLSTIESEIKKEDNLLKRLENVLYEIHLVNKVKNKSKLDDYENSLSDKFGAVEHSYIVLKNDVLQALEVCKSIHSDNIQQQHSKLINEIAGITNALRDIKNLSTDLGQYLGKALPQIEEYKEWIKKEQISTEWVENNIKSWINSETSRQ